MSRLALLALFLLASPVLAQEKAQVPQPQYVLRCNGAPFQSNTSHERLVKFFGAKNVSVEDRKTVLFSKDPARRIEITWLDDGGKTCPVNIFVSGEKNRWIGPYGVRTGMTIQQIERLNGAAFRIYHFGANAWVSANFGESKLGRPTPRCAISADFEFAGSMSPEFLKRFAGDAWIESKDPELLSLKPKVRSYSISYPPEC